MTWKGTWGCKRSTLSVAPSALLPPARNPLAVGTLSKPLTPSSRPATVTLSPGGHQKHNLGAACSEQDRDKSPNSLCPAISRNQEQETCPLPSPLGTGAPLIVTRGGGTETAPNPSPSGLFQGALPQTAAYFLWAEIMSNSLQEGKITGTACSPAPSGLRTARIKPEKQKPHLLDENQTKDQEFVPSLKDLFATAVILIKSPMFVCLSLARASESLVIIGTSALLPVYIESQFMLTPSDATTLSRFILILGDAIGQFLGGIIVYTMRMSCKCLMRFVMVTAVVSLVAFALIIFVHCDPIPFAGFNEDYGGTGHLGNLTAPCNSHCKCSSSFYSSTCGRDDIVYFSPCFAGCTHSKTLKDSKTYYNCSCIKDGIPTLDNQGDFIDARRGNCDAKCYELPLFAAFIFSALVFSGLSDIPNILTILWIIPDKQRSLALGVTCVILRLFGTIPGRIVFKILRDNSCIFGDAEHRGGSRNCWIYNKTKMMYLLVGACK
nr:solute carrier organic anion transporter family member 6A1 [Camelus dromedarius]